MFKSFIKTAWRNLFRNKSFSVINISGLAIGMAATILILLWIQHELTFDQFHAKKDRISQVWNRDTFDGKLQCWSTTPKIMGPTLKKDFPEVEEISRVHKLDNMLFAIGDKRLKLSGSVVDPGFLHIFSFPLIAGNPKTALDGSASMVLTEKLAKKLFGNEDPMGKTIRFDNADDFTVTGILKDLPNNTRFYNNVEYLIPWAYMKKRGFDDEYWENNSTSNFVLLRSGASLTAFNSKIKNITKEHTNRKQLTEVFLHPISKWHLYSRFENGKVAGGRIEIVRIFGIMAAFILLIACINFMNLSTARSEKRAKEVGIRKSIGAGKFELVRQFLGESILLAAISGVVALVIVWLSLPAFNVLTEKRLFLDYGNGYVWVVFLAFVVFTGLLAGSYPAFFLSSFRPVKVLKGTFKAANALITPRKVLVVMQFTFAIILVISTIIVQRQLKYAQHRQSGYDKENLVYVNFQGDISKNFNLIKHDLINQRIASTVTRTSSSLTEHWSDSWDFSWAGKDPTAKTDIIRFSADEDLVKLAGMQLAAGRDLNLRLYPTDSSGCLINEAAVKAMGFKEPIGQLIKDDDFTMHVVGVIKDFILESPYHPVQPMVIGTRSLGGLHIKLSKSMPTAQSLAAVEKVFNKYNPEFPFEYQFTDVEYASKFNNERQTATLAGLFAGLTIFISCLGLFGLAAYTAENRIKEIGIRKVMGASVSSITTLLSKDFVKLVLISIVIASPIAWWSMHSWLQQYPYRTSVSWWIFAVAGMLAVLIALATVSFQSIRAARVNPIKSLRAE
jgi:putative ABC transport system permease protein